MKIFFFFFSSLLPTLLMTQITFISSSLQFPVIGDINTCGSFLRMLVHRRLLPLALSYAKKQVRAFRRIKTLTHAMLIPLPSRLY